MKKQIVMLVLISINSMAMETLLQPTSSSWCAQGGKWSPQSHQGKSMLYFYNNTAPYYEFTNFYAPTGGITIDGKVWPTTEHYYQAMKFNDVALQEAVRKLPTPRAAFDFTKTAQNLPKVRSDWNNANLDIMRKAVFEKFSHDPVLKKLLLSTGDAVLVEDAGPKDAFYGAGPDCNGFNWLGKILMETREMLKPSAKAQSTSGASSSQQWPKWSPESHQGKTIIYFSSDETSPYHEFSNFYAPDVIGITIDGKIWHSTEHYYQAMKFNDVALQEAVRNQLTPDDAKRFAQKNDFKKRPDWNNVSLDIMRKANLEKFSNNPHRKALLLSTGDAILVQKSNDTFYGAGPDDNGDNWLGRILMEIREKLRAKGGSAQEAKPTTESAKGTSDQSEMNRRITQKFNETLLEDPTILSYEKITEKWDGIRDEARAYLGTFGSDKRILNIRIIAEGLGSVPTVEGKLAIKGDQNANEYYRKVRNSEVEKANKLIDEERYTRAIELLRPFTPDTSAKIIKTYIKMINYLAQQSKRTAHEQAAEALEYAKSLEAEIRPFGDIPAQFKVEKAALEELYNRLK